MAGEPAIGLWSTGRVIRDLSVSALLCHIRLLLTSALALHYPYVLAFEPTFVEVRHVETGSMSQIIQGNNLRCLFADTPPSTTHSSANMYNMGYSQGSFGPESGLMRQTSFGNRQSMASSRSVASSIHGQAVNYANPYPRTQAYGRDEIIMVSDDRVMALQLTAPAASDAASFVSH